MDYPSNPDVRLLNGKFTDGNPLTDTPPSWIPAAWMNGLTDEMLEVIEGLGGLVRSEGDRTQLRQAIEIAIESRLRSTVPAGTVVWYAAADPPARWLVCDGATVSRALYADLYAAIGETFGDGDGATTFAVPDLRGEYIRGWDSGRSVDPGRVFGAWQKGTLMAVDTANEGVWTTSSAGTSDYDQSRAILGVDPALSADYAGAALVCANPIVTSQLTGNSEVTYGSARVRNVALLPCIKY